LNILIILSLAGTIWGFKQQIFGVDAAEYRWLWDEKSPGWKAYPSRGAPEFFLFTSDCRSVWSISGDDGDANGDFGKCGPFPAGKRIWYAILAVIFFLGFAISGTRGALAVPLFGGLAYLITTRNFKILIGGVSAMLLVFFILKLHVHVFKCGASEKNAFSA